MTEPTNHELATEIVELKKQHAVLEERMKTLQSDLQGTLERFRADSAEYATAAERLTRETRSALERLRTDFERLRTDMADWKTDMAQRDTDLAQRDTHLVRTIYGAAALAAILMGAVIVLLEQLA